MKTDDGNGTRRRVVVSSPGAIDEQIRKLDAYGVSLVADSQERDYPDDKVADDRARGATASALKLVGQDLVTSSKKLRSQLAPSEMTFLDAVTSCFEEIDKLRDEGVSWGDIHRVFEQYMSIDLRTLRAYYYITRDNRQKNESARRTTRVG